MFQLFTSIPKMRKFFAIMVICCWIFAVPASQVATSLQIDSTYEEVVPIPTPIPTTELVFEQDDSKMARQAIQATLDKYALTFLPADTAITVLEFRQEGEWAYAEVTWPSLEIESMYVLAHQQENGRWQAALPFVNSLYSHWVAKIPADFLNISIDNNVLLNDDLHIDFRSFIQDDKLRYAIYQTLQAKPKDLFPGKQYAVTSLFQKDTWHFISIASINESGCSLRFVGNGDCGSYMIATNDQEFGWLVGLAGTPNFVDLLSNIPTSILPSESKFILNPNNQTLLKENALDYKFPWPSGKWEYRGGWHFSAVDIGTRDSDKRILSAASGVISVICRSTDGNSANVTIVHDDGTSLGYFHLDRHSLASNITEQARVIQGQVLGNLLPGTWSDNCGYTVGQASNSAHIHWVLPTS
ncbi:MAG: hypothetical protein KDE56_28255, partial [Anaerolineales bacterium]|nr:hypothetical protein [Anaerolineales bacterium]